MGIDMGMASLRVKEGVHPSLSRIDRPRQEGERAPKGSTDKHPIHGDTGGPQLRPHHVRELGGAAPMIRPGTRRLQHAAHVGAPQVDGHRGTPANVAVTCGPMTGHSSHSAPSSNAPAANQPTFRRVLGRDSLNNHHATGATTSTTADATADARTQAQNGMAIRAQAIAPTTNNIG